ncbi:hypothetical protein CfE428DRAFT_2664 [Chthoniobacter flavus Ellin428]|uniref:Peptidase S1 and S6 chymotrypsin/Hap n=1 Tax=Chthoniobacter flavus Ellin428 TaxID=497964 RepID=B4D163_9BACT|nr:serine protease [Chthoniobacter flavus]EDY20075.1 hypothetical protein CfE428DRAFT_2664 [Chthoniobacter flavus Ellin428]TCO93972.1 S1-C subfamily serine protease [Chthoniobacter flavus]
MNTRCCAAAAAALLSLIAGHLLAQVPASIATSIPAAPPAPAAPAAPAPPAVPLTPAEVVKANSNNLVFVQGTNGAGSGFIARLGGVNFLFTNAHVAAGVRGAGFKTLDGTQVQIGAASIAVGHDIFRLLVAQGGKPLEVMDHVDENASIDDEVVVLGNAEGGGVINTIKGKIVGIGPNLVEVDAPFVPGNSGSPIIHLKTGKVIAVATYLIIKDYDPATHQAIRQPRIRRFGYRVDSVKTWQPVNWAAFFAQANELENVEKLTDDLGRVLMDLAKHHDITPNLHTNPAIKTQIDWWTANARHGHSSARDAARADQNFIAGLKSLSQSDILAARQHITYDYFVHNLNEQQQQRKALSDVFDQILQEMRKMQ